MRWSKLSLCLFVSIILSACGSTDPLLIHFAPFSWEPKLSVTMEQVDLVDSEDMLVQQVYQEKSDADNLDSLIIAKEPYYARSLTSFVQQYSNQLKERGFILGEELSQKSLNIHTQKDYQTLLKTFLLEDLEKKSTDYFAQFFVLEGEEVTVFSYATKHSSHRKKFIKALSTISF